MTDINQNELDTAGLPELDTASDRPVRSKTDKKKPPIGFVVAVVLLLGGAGVGVQYAIEHTGLFGNKPVEVSEPPMPTIETNNTVPLPSAEMVESTNALSFDVGGPVSDLIQPSAITQQQSATTPATPDEFAAMNESVQLAVQQLGTVVAELSHQKKMLDEIVKQQSALSMQIDMEANQRMEWDQKIATNVKQNERWLGGISNQLKDIGVEVKVAAQEFPVVVYSRNIWGEDVYLTVANKANPDQTSFLRVGGIVGRWKLIEISEDKAVFEHFEGNRKEVML